MSSAAVVIGALRVNQQARGQQLLPFTLLPTLTVIAQLLTLSILVDSSTVICWMSLFVILGVSDLFCRFYSFFDGKFC